MNKTTIKQRPGYLKPGRNRVAVCCMVVYLLFLSLAASLRADTLQSSVLRPISWPEIETLLSRRSFVSKEELFQLLHQIHSRQQDMIRLDKRLIQKLSGTIQSLFPLGACESISLQDGTVKMIFDKPQDIHIPNSWHLASLKISEQLVLRIEKDQGTNSPGGFINRVEHNTRSVRFIIEQGYLQLDFSFLLKIFGNSFRDGQGSELLYLINEEKQVSSLALIEVTPLARQDISIEERRAHNQPGEYSWIDIHHSDFPDAKDIGIAANKISFLGNEIELLPEERIRIGDGEPRQDSEAYHHFKASIGRFMDLIHSGNKPMTVDYTRTFGYQFEERKKFLTIGFRSAEDKMSRER